MRTLFIFVGLLTLAGCVTEPIASTPTNNAGIQVDLLFEHDGCRVYRFRDLSYHYFAKCDGVGAAAGPNASILPDQCGKSGQECGSVPTY